MASVKDTKPGQDAKNSSQIFLPHLKVLLVCLFGHGSVTSATVTCCVCDHTCIFFDE